jgi:ribosomal protein S18 acetylase RimI-like enzyme
MDMLIRLYARPPEAVPPAGAGAGVGSSPEAPAASSARTSGRPRSAPARPPALTVRKPIGPEHDLIVAWVALAFGPGWASEARVALGNRPATLFVAVGSGQGDPARSSLQAGAAPPAGPVAAPAPPTSPPHLLGFACYDATARGMVGPIGVADAARGHGIGAALLLACLQDMHAAGYAYAVAGSVGAPAFFRRVAGAVEIPDSSPGLYAGMLRPVTD